MLIKTHSDFRLLWLAQLVSQLGDKVYALTIAWWVLELTTGPGFPEGDPSQVGYMMAVGALAATLFGPFLGMLADRFPRRSILIGADLARAGLCGMLAYAAHHGYGNLFALYFVVFLVAVFNLMFNPATHAILGSLVAPEEIHQALSLQQITTDMCNILGAALGGALVASLGVKLGLVVDAWSFVASAILISRIKKRESDDQSEDAPVKGGGLSFLKSQPTILGLLAIFALANMFLAPMFVMIPALSKIVLKGTPATLGMLEGALAAGSILTTAIILKMTFHKRWPSLCGAVTVNGLCLMGMAASHSVAPLAALLAVIGGCLATVNVQFICMLQHLTPEELKGRVFAVMETIATASFPFAFFLAGVAAAHFSIPQIFFGCGVGVVIAGLLVPLVPGVRQV